MTKVKYTKTHIDKVLTKAIYYSCRVNLTRMSDEDISNYLSNLASAKSNVSHNNTEECFEPNNKKMKFNETETNTLEVKTDKHELQTKSISNDIKNGESCNDTIPLPSCNNSDLLPTQTEHDDNRKEDFVIQKEEVDSTVLESEIELKNTDNLFGKIFIRDVRTMMDESKLEKFYELFLDTTPKTLDVEENIFFGDEALSLNRQRNPFKKQLTTHDIDRLYTNYFGSYVQDSIVIIANILNILLSNDHYKKQVDELLKTKEKTEMIKKKLDTLHEKRRKILESKLKNHLLEILSSFTDSEFECTFLLFFLCVLTVFMQLDDSKSKKNRTFENFVLLWSSLENSNFWNSLEDSDFDYHKVFFIIKSKSLHYECDKLKTLIENSCVNNPCKKSEMMLFFVSSINCDVFRSVIDAVTHDSDNFEKLLESAITNSFLRSYFEVPKYFSQVNKKLNAKLKTSLPLSQKTIDRTKSIHHIMSTENFSGTSQTLVSNETYFPQTSSITSVGSIVSNLSLNAFNNYTSNASSSYLIESTTLVFNSAISNNQPSNTASTQQVQSSHTYSVVDKIQYQLVNTSQVRTTINNNIANLPEEMMLLPEASKILHEYCN